jgi:hypothetical protein
MFGNLKLDEIGKYIKEGKEFFVPTMGQGLTAEDCNGGKVAKVGLMDFFKAAKARNRRQNPISPNQADYVNWVLYDRITFAQAAVVPQLTKLFVIPIGGSGKTKVDTNLEQVSTLPAPQWFNCTGVSIFFPSNTLPADAASFLQTEYMEFWVGSSKVYVEGPLDVFPGSGGIFANQSLGTVAAASTNVTSVLSNGWPSIHNMYDVRLPAGLPLGSDSNGAPVVADGIIGITILQSQTFNIQLKADGGGATITANGAVPFPGVGNTAPGLTVSARLHGILSRGVY